MEIRKEVHLNLIDKPLDETLMSAITLLIALYGDVDRFLMVCPSEGIVSDRFDEFKNKLENTVAMIKKTYGWD